MLRRALNLVKKIYEKRGSILFIPSSFAAQLKTDFDQKPSIQQTSNFAIKGKQSKKEVKKQELSQISLAKSYKDSIIAYTEASQGRKVLAELSCGSKGGIWPIPEALFILNVNDNLILIKEAMKLQLFVIGIIDSNTNPFGIQYPIPGNDDSIESLSIYTNLSHNVIVDTKKNEFTKICLVS